MISQENMTKKDVGLNLKGGYISGESLKKRGIGSKVFPINRKVKLKKTGLAVFNLGPLD